MSAPKCEWCGVHTNTESRVCRGCKGVMGQLGTKPTSVHALQGGMWQTRPGGIKVWVSWDEEVA